MSHVNTMLAVINEFEQVVSVQRNLYTSEISEGEIIFGAVGLVVVLSFLAILIFRKKLLRKRHRHRHSRAREALAVKSADISAAEKNSKSNGKRRRRRKHRRQNPTLAETRGLPPNRHEPSAGPSLY